MDFKGLWAAQAASLEDFWDRRRAQPLFRREGAVFGRAVTVVSNEEAVLTAVDFSLPLFSKAPLGEGRPFLVQIVVRDGRRSPGPPPEDLMNHTTYTGEAAWLMIAAGAWGQAFVDMAQGVARVVINPSLAARPDLVSHCLLNTILLNFCLGNGFGMLHASCLYREGSVLLLMAPHNTGKSTTALRLALAGYSLLTDSMVHISPAADAVRLCGFPVGRIKLRRDMVSHFPHLAPLLTAEQVRDETKYTLDLREVAAELVQETAVTPERVVLCLLGRQDREETAVRPAGVTAVWEAIMQNSLFYDTEAVWMRNLAQVERVIAGAETVYLTVGWDAAGIVTAVNQLWAG